MHTLHPESRPHNPTAQDIVALALIWRAKLAAMAIARYSSSTAKTVRSCLQPTATASVSVKDRADLS